MFTDWLAAGACLRLFQKAARNLERTLGRKYTLCIQLRSKGNLLHVHRSLIRACPVLFAWSFARFSNNNNTHLSRKEVTMVTVLHSNTSAETYPMPLAS
jgi:hypothetical protein